MLRKIRSCATAGTHTVRRVQVNGIIVRVAGLGTAGSTGDGGAATSAQVNSPTGVSPNGAGGLYIVSVPRTVKAGVQRVAHASRFTPPQSDTSNHAVRFVSGVGIITTVAGTLGQAGFAGDGNPATASTARLSSPTSVAYEPDGGLFISEQGNSIIRYVSPAGMLSTVAGLGTAGNTGDSGQCGV